MFATRLQRFYPKNLPTIAPIVGELYQPANLSCFVNCCDTYLPHVRSEMEFLTSVSQFRASFDELLHPMDFLLQLSDRHLLERAGR